MIFSFLERLGLYSKKAYNTLYERVVHLEAENQRLLSKTHLDLTRECLGLVTTNLVVEALEVELQRNPELWKSAETIVNHPAFNAVIDSVVLTQKDKIAMECELGSDNLLLNKGAMNGAELVRTSMRSIASKMQSQKLEKPLKGINRFKSV